MHLAWWDENETLGVRGRMWWLSVLCLNVRMTRSRVVLSNLHCQVDWIYNHHGNIPISMPIKVFPLSFNWGERIMLNVYGAIPWTGILGWRKCRKQAENQFSSLSPSASWFLWWWNVPSNCEPHVSVMMNSILKLSQWSLSSWIFCHVFSHSNGNAD